MIEMLPNQLFKETLNHFENLVDQTEANALSYLVLEKVFGLGKTKLIINEKFIPTLPALSKYSDLIKRSSVNEPIQYILEEADFFGRQFYVNKHVLIPRQETELLIQIILEFRSWEKPKIVDIGTGSGCIACSLGLEIKEAKVYGYDISTEALKVANQNSDTLSANVQFEELDILNHKIPEKELDILISNPPYVTVKEKTQMHQNVLNFEPELALFVPNDDPLLFYKIIIQQATNSLKKGGLLIFEINEKYGSEVKELLIETGLQNAKIHLDLNHKERFVSATLS